MYIIIRNIIEYSHNYNQIIKENADLEKQLLKQSNKREIDDGTKPEE